MCNPALVIGAIGIGLQVAGSYKASQAQSSAAEYQADVDDYNAKSADYEAIDAEQRGAKTEAKHRSDVKLFAGSQESMMGASGLELGSGTFGNILEDTSRGGAADEATIRSNTRKEAWYYRNQAKLFRYQRDANLSASKAAENAGFLSSGGTALTGASSLYSRYSKNKEANEASG